MSLPGAPASPPSRAPPATALSGPSPPVGQNVLSHWGGCEEGTAQSRALSKAAHSRRGCRRGQARCTKGVRQAERMRPAPEICPMFGAEKRPSDEPLQLGALESEARPAEPRRSVRAAAHH